MNRDKDVNCGVASILWISLASNEGKEKQQYVIISLVPTSFIVTVAEEQRAVVPVDGWPAAIQRFLWSACGVWSKVGGARSGGWT